MKKIMFVAMALLLGLASCVKDKQYGGITISNLSYTPTAVTEFSDVTVSATITSFKAVTANLHYVIGEEESSPLPMNEAGGVYTAVIPAQPNGTVVTFWVEAENEECKETSQTMEYEVGAVAVDYSVLRLNELNGHDKFIEIYNEGMEALNLNGVYIVKDGDNQNWTGTSGVVIEAGGYLVLYSEDVIDPNDPQVGEAYIFHSGLSAKKNVRIQLFTPAGESIDDFNLTNIDLNGEAYGSVEAPASYSRNADGEWYYADATPGAVNVDGTNIVLGLEGGVTPEPPTPNEPDYTKLVLNELNGDTKFIELYNMGDLDLELTSGMYIEKDDKPEPVWIADGTITVPAHGYALFYSADVLADHPELEGTNYLFNSGLSGKKVIRIALFMADGTQLDEFIRGNGEYGATISNVGAQSYARIPDGGEWMLADPTPGAANPATGDPIPQE